MQKEKQDLKEIKKLAAIIMAAIVASTPVTSNVQAASTSTTEAATFTQVADVPIQYTSSISAAQVQEAANAYAMLPETVKQLFANKGIVIYICNTDEAKYLPGSPTPAKDSNGVTRTGMKKVNGQLKISSQYIVIWMNNIVSSKNNIAKTLLHESGHAVSLRSYNDGQTVGADQTKEFKEFSKKYLNTMRKYADSVQNSVIPDGDNKSSRYEMFAASFAACILDPTFMVKNAPDLYDYVMNCAATAYTKDI